VLLLSSFGNTEDFSHVSSFIPYAPYHFLVKCHYSCLDSVCDFFDGLAVKLRNYAFTERSDILEVCYGAKIYLFIIISKLEGFQFIR